MPTVPRILDKPSKIVCVGRNYAEHAKELGNEVPKEPLIFLKPPSSIIGDGDSILLPPQSRQVEFEGEIGILLGETLHHANEAVAGRAVRAVLAANDVTARDLQRLDSQWTRAKGFNTFCPVGEPGATLPPLDDVTLVTRVNGAERQRAHSTEMVFPIAALLAYISTIMSLEPGDLVLTGTPAGVGALQDGDVVEVEIEGMSSVRNPVRSAS